MAVQKNKKSKSKSKIRRFNNIKIKNPSISIDFLSGELHLRHHITNNGFYRGKKIYSKDNK
ncbi:50S ribosomal protein L32 [endosymbiont of Pachyrhynchus infernalis]|uniref:50S ribosomal protein L32 n=1 Tax=endosymbiont of Pachyrhynchus infernalis TaxID=1971488 RepID=UPI000DC6EB8C|nr:50S ribosomal protein L32 [endosymbiont of Pachyrhynchus infernalis]BBA84889.1 50S ribosomal protein L32 [endosymbiont of Pachyrhynchus infernalis]